MCRLYVVTRRVPQKVLEKNMKVLEDSCGGNGNGLGWWDNGKKIEKGVKKTCEELSKLAAVGPYPKLFHTRLATHGGVFDDLCHPFDAGDHIVAHNGIWSSYDDAKWTLLGKEKTRDIVSASDSLIAAMLIKHFGDDVLDLIDSGMWVTIDKDGSALLWNFGGSFYFWKTRWGWNYASEVLDEKSEVTKCMRSDTGSVIFLGKEPEVLRGKLIETPVPIKYSGGDWEGHVTWNHGKHVHGKPVVNAEFDPEKCLGDCGQCNENSCEYWDSMVFDDPFSTQLRKSHVKNHESRLGKDKDEVRMVKSENKTGEAGTA